jgi:protein-disulfide isomerase
MEEINMEKRIFTLILVVAVGVLMGVLIVAKQSRDPMLKSLLQQQTAIFKMQKKIDSRLASDKREGTQEATGGSDLSNILSKQQALEQRLTALENQWQGLQVGLRQAAGGRAGVQQAQGNPGQNVRQAPPPEDFSKVHDIEVAHSPVFGKKDAPVTLVEFVDFQCPFCARFHPPMTEAAKAYPDKVNYMLKNFPLSFHPQARPASKAAFAAGEQGKYWEMADALMANGNSLSEDKFEELAKGLGLNMDKFLKDYKDKDAKWEDFIQKDMALGSQVGVRGTPTFYINGRKTNARDVISFKKEIEQILKEQK